MLNNKGELLNEYKPDFGSSSIGEEATTYKKMQEEERLIGLGKRTKT